MARLEVNDQRVGALIEEVAPLVEQITGWPVPPTARRSRTIPQELGYEEIVMGRLRGLGLDPEPAMRGGLLGRLVERVIEANVLAAYEPSVPEILVVRENVDDSNLNGLRLVLAHELVHGAQHGAHPELFARLDRILRDAFLAATGSEDEMAGLAQMVEILEQARPIMTLLESHAHQVQRELVATTLKDAAIESHFNVAALLLRIAGRDKVAQYRDSLPEVAAAMALNRVNELYARLK